MLNSAFFRAMKYEIVYMRKYTHESLKYAYEYQKWLTNIDLLEDWFDWSITCSKLTLETLEQSVKYVES